MIETKVVSTNLQVNERSLYNPLSGVMAKWFDEPIAFSLLLLPFFMTNNKLWIRWGPVVAIQNFFFKADGCVGRHIKDVIGG